jgi:hypothetical protein
MKAFIWLFTALLIAGCSVAPKFGFHYDFINKRFTVTAEPGDGKTVK